MKKSVFNNKFPIYLGKSKINGKGSFAARNIKKGEIVNIFGGDELSEAEVDLLIEKGKLRLDDPFQVDDDRYLVCPGSDYFTNHSCSPNVGIKNSNQLVAITNIKKDDEITYDYSTTTGKQKMDSKYRNDDWIMDCNCGSENCRGKVSYILSLPRPTIEKYLELEIIPDFIKKSLKT